MRILNPPLTDADLLALRERTQQRREQALVDMGSSYTLHPVRQTYPTTDYGREVRDRRYQ
jgi:hypothetical protein